MRKWLMLGLGASLVVLGGCEDDVFFVGDDEPDAPRNLEARYFEGAVELTWELGPSWDGDVFRVYGKRVSDSDYFLIAEVTSCLDGVCVYRDVNVIPGETYEYFVSAVDPNSGFETDSARVVEVFVPEPAPPPVPSDIQVVALDGANYILWSDDAATASDFSFYRIYLADDSGTDFLLGETDSNGFVDFLAENGLTYTYTVSSVDDQGHESSTGALASGTPRPDYHGELIFAYEDRPGQSAFRFQEFEDVVAIVDGDSPDRHFRVELDADGYWLLPGPGAEAFPEGQFTTTLKCGVAADADCASWELAPSSGYTTQAVPLDAEFTYMLRVPGDDGQTRYGAIRVALQGVDQNDDALMVFDWAYQTQVGNPNLSPVKQ